MNLDLFLNAQFLDYTPSDNEWEEKEAIEEYILCYFEEEINDFPNFPRHLLNWYHAKEESISDDDQRQCLINCYLLAAAETIDFHGYSIDDDGTVTTDLDFTVVDHFTGAFLCNLHQWHAEFM